MYSHTLWREPGCKLLAFGFTQRSEVSRNDGRQDVSKSVQQQKHRGLAKPVNPCNSDTLHFVVCWAPTWEFRILFYHQICEKAFQYWCFFKLFVLKVSKGKPAAYPLALFGRVDVCAGLLHPWALEGPWVLPLQLGRHKCTKNPVPAHVPSAVVQLLPCPVFPFCSYLRANTLCLDQNCKMAAFCSK